MRKIKESDINAAISLLERPITAKSLEFAVKIKFRVKERPDLYSLLADAIRKYENII